MAETRELTGVKSVDIRETSLRRWGLNLARRTAAVGFPPPDPELTVLAVCHQKLQAAVGPGSSLWVLAQKLEPGTLAELKT